jgi:hypothetical protein
VQGAAEQLVEAWGLRRGSRTGRRCALEVGDRHSSPASSPCLTHRQAVKDGESGERRSPHTTPNYLPREA